MSASSDSGRSTKKKKKIAFCGVAWLPVKPPPCEFTPIEISPGVYIAECSTSSTGIYATRSGSLITLGYSLRATRPIVFVTVTIQDYGVTVASAPLIVPPWCLDLDGSTSNVAKLADTAIEFGVTYKTKPVLIKVTYDTDTTDAAGTLQTNV